MSSCFAPEQRLQGMSGHSRCGVGGKQLPGVRVSLVREWGQEGWLARPSMFWGSSVVWGEACTLRVDGLVGITGPHTRSVIMDSLSCK